MSIKLGYGLITCQRHPDDPPGWGHLYREALELAEQADRGGLDSVWVSEHHSFDDGYLPSVMPVLAAIAAVTEHVALGTGVLLASFQHPIRVAEDAAVVDLLSQGRLILGVGLGWRAEEFASYGAAESNRVRALNELVTTCRDGWAGRPTRHSAEHGDFAYITPRPDRPGGPPVWIGARVEASIRRAARIADGFMADSVGPDAFGDQVRLLHAEAERLGRPIESIALGVHVATFVTDSPDPMANALDALHYQSWKYGHQRELFGATDPLPSPPPPDEARVDELRSRSVVGSPAEVAARIREYQVAAGGHPIHFVARSYYPGLGRERQRAALDGLLEVKRLLSA